MNYRTIDQSLHATADAVRTHFRTQQGVTKFLIEQPLDGIDVEYRPTLHAKTKNNYYVCIEISEVAYKSTLDSFVLDCINKGVPAKLYVARNGNIKDMDYEKNIKTLRARGVGLLEVGSHIDEILSPQFLSLAALRPINIGVVPNAFKAMLAEAHYLFKNGNPEEGCSNIYKEIESYSRKICRKTHDSGFWTSTTNSDFDKQSWNSLIKELNSKLDYSKTKPKYSEMDEQLILRVIGVTDVRNKLAHKIKSLKDRKARDERLRTIFEAGVDLLIDLLNSTKALKIK